MRKLSRTLISIAGLMAVRPITAQDEADVLTQRHDNHRSGAYLTEKKLNTSNVNKHQFGKLAYRLVDGNVYAQPLIVTHAKVTNRTDPNATDMVIVATEHNSVYAFNAQDTYQNSTTAQLWHTDNNVLGKPVPYTEVSEAVGLGQTGCKDLTTEIGITSTPVIEITNNTSPKEGVVFLVGKSKNGNNHIYKLFALDLAGGTKISDVMIKGEVRGKGFGSTGSGTNQKIVFDPMIQLNRPALLLDGKTLWIAFGGHCDEPRLPNKSFHGWLFAYDVSDPKAPKQLDVFCTTPNGRGPNGPMGPDEGGGGIWMSGTGPSVDDSGNIYFSAGDGSNDGTPKTTDYGDSVVKVKLEGGKITVQDFFAPYNQTELKEKDLDLGSGGAVPIKGTQLLLAGGKEGVLYLIDTNENMMGRGGNGAHKELDSFIATRDHTGKWYYNIHGAPIVWERGTDRFVYVDGEESSLNEYKLNGNGTFVSPAARHPFDPLTPFGTSCPTPNRCVSAPFPGFPTGMFGNPSRDKIWMPGGFLALSADEEQEGTGIIWDSMPFAGNANQAVVLGVLRAFDASDVSNEIWNSEEKGNPNDKLGQFAKFCPPVVFDGKVYVAAFQAELAREGSDLRVPLQGGDQPALVIYGLK